MRWLTLIFLCVNLVCHYKTWDGVSRVFFKVERETNFLDQGARIKDDYVCAYLDVLKSELDMVECKVDQLLRQNDTHPLGSK